MKKRNLSLSIYCIVILLYLIFNSIAKFQTQPNLSEPTSDPEYIFLNPPESCQTRGSLDVDGLKCNQEGVHKDLEALKEQGNCNLKYAGRECPDFTCRLVAKRLYTC